MRDLLFVCRSLLKNRSASAIAVLTLALGIGATTAIFSVVKAVLLNPLPYRDAERLLTLSITAPDRADNPLIDPFTARDLAERSHSIESLTLYGDVSAVLLQNGRGELVRGLRVTSNFFDTLGVKMQLGRPFLQEEDRPDRKFTAVILSDGFWMRHFGGDRGVVGRVLELSGFHYRITGVLPENFAPLLHGTTELLPEIYMPAGIDYSVICRTCLGPRAIARLKLDITVEQARSELNVVMTAIVGEHARDYDRDATISVLPLRDFLFGRVSGALWAVLAAAGFVLLIACANVANLLLARGAARSKEVAMRAALGAGRGNLIRQIFAESFVLAAAGGVAGLLTALGGTHALASALPLQVPRAGDIRADGGVLGFSLAATLVTTLLCGLAPWRQMARLQLGQIITGSWKAGRSRHRLERALVVGEVALALVLLYGALLMAKSFARLTNVDPGYDTQGVLTASSNLWGERYQKESAGLAYYQRTLERIHTLPGVEDAAWTSMLPLDAADREPVYLPGRAARESEAPLAEMYSVSASYFRVMKVPLKRGRLFTEADTALSPKVALISESGAARLFPHENAIGQHIQIGRHEPNGPWATIVGVVGDIRQYGLDRPPNMEVYLAQAQGVIIGYYRLVARTEVPPMRLESAIRGACASVDSTLPIYHVKPLAEYLAGTLAARSVTLSSLVGFAALALVLAGAGIYAVISYLTALRTREIGIRMALGAERRRVVALVELQTAAPVLVGLAIGIAAARFLALALTTLLFEVQPYDWQTEAAAAFGIVVVGLAAGYVPARRAAGLDPARALREE